MARTIQVIGNAYALTGNVSINAVVDGNTVHNGIVPTSVGDGSSHTGPDGTVLFELVVPDTMYNLVVASSFTVTGGIAFIAGLYANNIIEGDLAAFDPLWQETATLKTNVTLDGALMNMIEPEDGWNYRVPDGSTMTIDWNIPELKGDIPGHPKMLASNALIGSEYRIVYVADTDFIAMGAADNIVGTTFTCTATAPLLVSPDQTGKVFPTQG